jgi:hypothetical protein
MPLLADAVRAERLQRARAQWPRLAIAGVLVATLLVACLTWRHLVLWLIWLSAAAVVARRALRHGVDASFVASTALLFVLFLGLRVEPDALHQLAASYRADSRFTSFQQSEAFEESDYGVDSDFIAYVGRHLPQGDSFYVAVGDSVGTSAPQAWLQFQLLPSIEIYGSPCAAKWVVFYADTVAPPGLTVDRLLTYRPGYALGRVGAPCTV